MYWAKAVVVVVVGCLLGCAIPLGANAGSDGVGSPFSGDASDVDRNPAALGESGYRFQFLVTPASGRLRMTDWSIDSVIRAFQGLLTPEQQSELIDGLQDGELQVFSDLSGGARVAFGGNSAGANLRGYVQAKTSADAARLLLLGSTPGTVYDLEGTQAEGVALGTLDINSVYSDPWLANILHISGFHMGGTLRYLHGLEYARAQVSGSTLTIIHDGDAYKRVGDGRIYTWRSSSGWGFSTDLGLMLRLTPSIAVDVSIVDFGRIWWHNVQKAVFEYRVDPATGTGTFENSGSHAIPHWTYWDLPTSIRGGLDIQASPGVLWSLQYSKCLSGPMADHYEWMLGTQLSRLEILPLRLGARYSSQSKDLAFSLGMGIRLGPLTLDIDTPNLGSLLTREKEAGLTVSTGFRF